MHHNIPFHIADHSITFFVNRGSYTVADDNPNFHAIQHGLMEGALDPDRLCEMADIRVALARSLNGRLTLYGNGVAFDGVEIHNVWVEKLFGFVKKGLPFHPVIEALASLMENPSSTARERLPIFVEQSRLGFLPDGRIAALKVVQNDYKDVYSGTFDNTPGNIVSIDRAACDPNPDKECSHGLHVGAYDYLPSYGLNDPNKKVILCAFWPRDVVAVPRDYNGQKMRVSSYEVLVEMDKSQLKDFIGKNETVVDTWTQSDADLAAEFGFCLVDVVRGQPHIERLDNSNFSSDYEAYSFIEDWAQYSASGCGDLCRKVLRLVGDHVPEQPARYDSLIHEYDDGDFIEVDPEAVAALFGYDFPPPAQPSKPKRSASKRKKFVKKKVAKKKIAKKKPIKKKARRC